MADKESKSEAEIKLERLDKEIEQLLKDRGWTKKGDTWLKFLCGELDVKVSELDDKTGQQ